jgi:hypothetical protein
MAIVTPFIFLETAGTKMVEALSAHSQTVGAVVVIATGACETALGTVSIATVAAARFAAATDALFAPLAYKAVVAIHDSATIDTGSPKPDFQIHKRTIGVVGPEATCHECEEVK